MGNCQAIDAATLVIQHPSGKVEKLYWPVSASEIMKTNPGHYVALLISTTLCPVKTNENGGGNHENPNKNIENNNNNNNNTNSVRFTRIKLLRASDTLVLGQVYRLITSQEVMKGLWAKKQAKLKKKQPEVEKPLERQREKQGSGAVKATRGSELEKDNQVITKHERHRPRTATATQSATARSRTWQPSLKSISEAGS